MKSLLVVLAAIAAFGFVGSASAADMPVKAVKAPVAVGYNWTGFYIGVNGGYGWGRESYGENTILPCPPCVPVDHSPTGGIFGGQAGYRWQINQFVLGLEGSWDWANLRSSVATFPGGIETFKIRSIYSATGQAGLALDRWLLYVKGGWAGATTNFQVVATGLGADHSQTANGWTVGAGIDYAVWQNLILGVEYDHFDLDYSSFTTPEGPVTDIVANTSRLKIDQVVARLSYKFNWP